ncbi:hypothetical protein [Wenjunlia vitaminophila]|uniref:hypothetical protein n=1 Tax=Wenjunlia vitaminophila TaxID=76728 RepID=UPI000382A76C|nr:hypothetical protein [Wenjunlia vitaminophila]
MTVKTRWRLSVDEAERTALWQVAAGCLDQRITVETARCPRDDCPALGYNLTGAASLRSLRG